MHSREPVLNVQKMHSKEPVPNVLIMVTTETNPKESELKERIFSFADEMKKREDELIIIGHDNIDADAFLSGLLISRVFDFIGIKNRFYVLEPVAIENETFRIVEKLFGLDMRNWVIENFDEDDNRLLFLEDHFETFHKGKVIGCIDHHPTSKLVDFEFVYRKISCATAYMVYELMQLVGYQPSKEEVKMIIVAMMIDTVSFRSSKTVQKEVEVAKHLAEKYEFDYDALIKYCLCLTPIDSMKIGEIVSNGQKYYNYAGNKVGSSYLQLYAAPDEMIINWWLRVLHDKILKEKLKMQVFIIVDIKNNKTYEYRISKKNVDEICHEEILSRGQNIMPEIEKSFN